MDYDEVSLPNESEMVVQARSVGIFVKRVNFTFSALLLLGGLMMYFLVFVPLEKALENSLLDNFSQIALVNDHAVQNNVQRSIEGARSLSSRTMIKNVIKDYSAGKLSLDELKSYTQPKYEDGAKALAYLVSAERMVDGTAVARHTAAGGAVDMEFPEAENPAQVASAIRVAGDHAYAVIQSPIVDENTVLGYDRLVYDLTDSVHMLSTQTVKISLLNAKSYQALLRDAKMVREDDKLSVFRAGGYYLATTYMQNDVYCVTLQSESTLFVSIHQLSAKILAAVAAILVCFAILVNLYIVRFAKMELGKLEIRQTALKKVASQINFDPLTNAGNRRYAEKEFMLAFQAYRETGLSPAILMFDIDSFKHINDAFGHDAGDQVLKKVVSAVQKAIRNRDKLFRWGGDEFVGICYDVSSESAAVLAEKVLKAVDSLHIAIGGEFIKPTISLGVSRFETGDTEFSDAVKRADKAMYQSKAQGGNARNML